MTASRNNFVVLQNAGQSALATSNEISYVDEAASYRHMNLPNAMTVDVEDYFQVSAFDKCVAREDWPNIESRLPRNIDRILQLFSDSGTKATFFTLGFVCEQMPEMIRRIADEGHEIASHGYSHERVTSMSRDEFREDVARTRQILESTTGAKVLGYRAPSFSIGCDNLWALDVLQETGHTYSSSIFPVSHDHYGFASAPRFPYRLTHSGLLEIPPTTVSKFGRNWPSAGGGYFRFLPLGYSIAAIRRVCDGEGLPAVFYFHPWELDPDQPRIEGVSLKTRFRHYVNLSKMEKRLEQMLKSFTWGRMDTVFLRNIRI